MARRALNDPATRPLALTVLGTIRLQEGRYEESTAFLTQALKLNPHLTGAQTVLGSAYVMQHKPTLARKSFEQALRLDPANDNARYDLAKLEAASGNIQRSLDVARPITSRLAKSPQGLLLLASDYASLKDLERLKSLVPLWRALPETTDQMSIEFGEVLMESGMVREANAILEFQKAKAAGQASVPLTISLAKSYLLLGNLHGAEQNFDLALQSNSGCVACDEGIAAVAERQNNTEKALAYLIKAKQLDPQNPEILFQFGKVCLERNLIEDALPALQKAAALKPGRDDYIYVLASANVSRGNLPKAASLLTGLLRKHPNDPVLNYALGAVYYLQGKYDRAESSLARSLQKRPNQVAAAYYMALTYNHLGSQDRALAILRDLIRRHPSYAPSYITLGTILAAQRHSKEAEATLKRAVALDPGSAQAHYQLYLLYRTLGETAASNEQRAMWHKLQVSQRARADLELRLLSPN